MSESIVRISPGETWINGCWGVLVLEVRPSAPPEVTQDLSPAGADSFWMRNLAQSPHALCLVLYDTQGSWVEGSTRWVDQQYIAARCTRFAEAT